MSFTPMMQQYMEIKQQHQDALLMFRLGDFYELFFEDATVASQALGLTLTGRDAGPSGKVPMCGVPFHAVDQYIDKLVDLGYCVAICNQTEDPKQAKGLVKREVIRIVTPGTSIRDEGAKNRILAAIIHRKNLFGLGMIDVSTGEVWCAETKQQDVIRDFLLQWQPAELLVYEHELEGKEWAWFKDYERFVNIKATERPKPRLAARTALDTLCRQFNVPSLAPLDLADQVIAAEAVGVALSYVEETQKASLAHVREPQNLFHEKVLVIDHTAMRNLEIVENANTRQRKGSLLDLLDKTHTAMGSRLLRRFLERPLQDIRAIEKRLDAVESLSTHLLLRNEIETTLAAVQDLDRLIGKCAFGAANARDVLSLAKSLERLPMLKQALEASEIPVLMELASGFPDLHTVTQSIVDLLVDEPPVSIREGAMIRTGCDSELDELKSINLTSKTWLAELERRERERTGIKTLKVGYNKVFGYYLEVSKSYTSLVPDGYQRLQTLANNERYGLAELKAQETRILSAQERAVEREYDLFCALRDKVVDERQAIIQASELIALLDVYASLAQAAVTYHYARPKLTEERGICIISGRHPVVEAACPGKFVPNDVTLNDAQQFILLTGPNMAGKSTYMRQIAMIVLLAHIGSFVPAQSAEIGIVDRIFTRIGASDDLSRGQSTFMVEMVEVAQILRRATDRSLVLLDEIGRGTSTYDGLCIAEAVTEALQKPGRNPLTLFATHYHELTDTIDALPAAANYSVSVEEHGNEVAFLHTVVPEPASQSYGIQVAKLAGLPQAIIHRAKALLEMREAEYESAAAKEKDVSRPEDQVSQVGDLPLFSASAQQLINELAGLDVLQMNPLEALNKLFELVSEAKDVNSWDSLR